MELLIISVIALIFLLIAFLYLRGKEKSLPMVRQVRVNREAPRSQEVHPAAPPEAEPAEESLQNPLDHVKGQIRAGIQTLFSLEETEGEPEMAKPLIYSDVDRQVLAQVTEQIESIQNFRSVHQRLQKILNDPALNVISALSTVIIADPILSSKVLKIVNSAYFGRSQKVNSIGHALFLLGMVHLREILYREGMLELMKVNDPQKDGLIDVFWRHATITSICAAHIRGLYPGLDQGTLFTAGLIHDVGKLILVRMSDGIAYTTLSTIKDEERIFGINHALAGRLALEKWGFSELMISVVVNHHLPASTPIRALKLSPEVPQYLIVLFLANQMAKMIQPDENYLPVEPLHSSYRPFIDQEGFTRAALDGILMTQISKSEAFIV